MTDTTTPTGVQQLRDLADELDELDENPDPYLLAEDLRRIADEIQPLTTAEKIKAIEESGLPLAFDGCHKIYFLQDEGRVEQVRAYGYEILPASELRVSILASCKLVYVTRWGLDSSDINHRWNIGQGTKDIFTAAGADDEQDDTTESEHADLEDVSLQPGAYVETLAYGYKGRVTKLHATCPEGTAWLMSQSDPRMREHPGEPWVSILVHQGGSCVIPLPLVKVISAFEFENPWADETFPNVDKES